MPFHPTIESMLTRTEESRMPLSMIVPTDEEEGHLGKLWKSLTTPIYHVLAEYPVNGEYQQQDSGVKCRQVPPYTIWLCVDDDHGFYLASQEECEHWTLEEEK